MSQRTVAVAAERRDVALRRRLVALGLGLSRSEMRTITRAHPSKISLLLHGTARLNRAEAAAFRRLASQRIRQLFSR